MSQVDEARRRHEAYRKSPKLTRERNHADAWCAAFVQPKVDYEAVITTSTLESVATGTADDSAIRLVHDEATRFQFFHWWLEFPEIFEVSTSTTTEPNGWRGGFTAVVGNPPWERIKLQEQEFFAQRDPQVAEAPNAAARKRVINALTESNPVLAAEWAAASRQAEATSHFLRKSNRYPLCGVGDINTYAVFAELFRSSIERVGRMGIITPTGLATDATTSGFFADTVNDKRLACFFDFVTGPQIWSGIGHNRFRFAVSAITGGRPTDRAALSFDNYHPDDLRKSNAILTLVPDEITLLNPNTGTLPIFASQRDADITLAIYRRFPVLMRHADHANPWGLTFATMFHMASDSGLFETQSSLIQMGAEFDRWAWHKGPSRWLPLYEAKMLSHWDHRFSTYEGIAEGYEGTALPRLTDDQHGDPDKEPLARYWVATNEVDEAVADRWNRGWFLGWRDIARASDMRTFVPSVMPRTGIGNPFPLAMLRAPGDAPLLHATMTSFVFDYVGRQKTAGTHMTYNYVYQFAAPPPELFKESLAGVSGSRFEDWVRLRVLELTYTSWRIAPYANDCLGIDPDVDPGSPFQWIPERREVLRAELDAAMFHLYGLGRDDVEHVMDSFAVLRKYDERDHGEFRVKRLILEIYDAMTDAAAHGQVYESPLDPPAGSGPRHDARSQDHREVRL
jgi:hypothetical protein